MTASRQLAPPEVVGRGGPARRGSFGLGPRTFQALLLGFVWLLPGFWDPRFLPLLPLWDLLVLAAWLYDLHRLPRPESLEVRRLWCGPVALSNPVRVSIELRSDDPSPLRGTIIDDPPMTLRRESPVLPFESIPHRPSVVTYTITAARRGDQRMGSVIVRYRGAVGLAERLARVELDQTVRVFPNLEQARRHALYLVRTRQIAQEKRLRRRRGLGREFESLRDYRQGDSWRDICWTATARRGRPITRVYQVERSQAVWIVIDTGRLLRERIGSLDKLDYSVNAALSVAQVALRTGDRVGLLSYGRTLDTPIGAARGSPHLSLILNRLATLQAGSSEADHHGAVERLRTVLKRRGLVIWLTDLAETAAMPDVIECATSIASRHAILFVLIGQPDLVRAASTEPEDAGQMYRFAAAQEILQRRERALLELQTRGVLAIEIAPQRLSTSLVNRYLEVKERGLI